MRLFRLKISIPREFTLARDYNAGDVIEVAENVKRFIFTGEAGHMPVELDNDRYFDEISECEKS